MGLQRRQRPAGHLPQLHRLGRRAFSRTATGSRSTTRLGRRPSTTWSRLINDDHVAPPASDTNDNGDFSRNQFLAGRMALFQSGTYNLAAIADQATFRWGVAMLPTGPAAGSASPMALPPRAIRRPSHPDAVRAGAGLDGQHRGQRSTSAASGAAIPAVLAAQRVYFDYWARRGVDVSRSSRCSTAPASRRRAAPASPPDIRRSSRTSTRCSWAAPRRPTLWRSAQAAANAAAER